MTRTKRQPPRNEDYLEQVIRELVRRDGRDITTDDVLAELVVRQGRLQDLTALLEDNVNVFNGVRLSFNNGNRFTATEFLAEANRRLTRVNALIDRFNDATDTAFLDRVRRLIRRIANGGGRGFPVFPFYGGGFYGGFMY